MWGARNFVTSSFLKPIVSSLTDVSDFIALLLEHIQTRIKGKETLVGFALIVFGTNAYYWHKHSHWSKRNVKTPRPIPIFGNFHSFLIRPRQRLETEWPKKYGKVYGYYMGTKPYLVCADAQILKKLCIKDFDKFPNRFFIGVRNKYQKHFMILQKDDHWRSMRALLTPTFTSGKMKIMSRILDRCADDLVSTYRDEIDKANGEAIINLKQQSAAFAMCSSVESFFGISLTSGKNAQNSVEGDNSNTKENFARNLQLTFYRKKLNFILTFLLPQPILSFFNIPLIRMSQLQFFIDKATKMVQHRQQSSVKKNDFLQLLLNAKLDNELELAASDQQEEHHALLDVDKPAGHTNGQSTWRPSKMRLTEMEVVCNVLMLLIVSAETTSTLLSHAMYLLAYHPEVQERLYNELMKIRATKEAKNGEQPISTFDYEQLTSCEYLDCVVSETLRLMPSALNLDREASEDYYIEEYDIHVPKGTVIDLAFYAILRDPDYWPEPEKFDPERFRSENKRNIIPGSYCPFGIGPRNCIGYRFALTEAKIGLAKLVSEFKISTAPGTKYPPDYKKFTFINNVAENLFASVKRRT